MFALRLGVSWRAARQWVQRCRCEGRVHRLEEDVIVENARLWRENQRLRDTNEVLKAASAFFRVRTWPAMSELIAFIGRYRDRFSVCVHLRDVECSS